MKLDVFTDEAERLKRKTWIQTYTGKAFHPLTPDPAAVCIEDIAHALAQKARFTGHTRRFYSVAEHSMLVAETCGLAGLLHDAAEAYLPDIAAPIKRFVTVNGETFKDLEGRVMDAILVGLGMSWLNIDSGAVKHADLAVLAAEREQCFDCAEPGDWGLTVPAASVLITFMTPEEAEQEFLRVWRSLR